MQGNSRVNQNHDSTRSKRREGLDQAKYRGRLQNIDVGCGPPTPIITWLPSKSQHNVIQEIVFKALDRDVKERADVGQPTHSTIVTIVLIGKSFGPKGQGRKTEKSQAVKGF